MSVPGSIHARPRPPGPAPARAYRRYVAVADSSTEGLDDPDAAGGWRGWADRLAVHVERAHPGLQYANLGIRGRLASQVRREQLPVALALQPDLVTAFAGVNDLLRPSCDVDAVVGDLEAVLGALTATGATVVTITVPDPGRIRPLARPLRGRVAAYNAGVLPERPRYGPVPAGEARWPGAGLIARAGPPGERRAGAERAAATGRDRAGQTAQASPSQPGALPPARTSGCGARSSQACCSAASTTSGACAPEMP